MIPRRNITIYGGLFGYLVLYLENLFLKKNYGLLFEKKLQEYFFTESVFLFNYGRSALSIIFEIVKYKQNDEIIVSSYYLKELIPLLKKRNLNIVFCDINRKTLSLDVNKLISKITPKTKFIILPHMFGISDNLEKSIKSIRKKNNNIIVIEDCAHAFGSEYKNKKLGVFGDFSFFSFDYIKPLNLLSGGLLVVNNDKHKKEAKNIYKKIKKSDKRDTINRVFRYYFICLMLKNPFFLLIKIFLRNKITKKILKKIYKPTKEKEIKKLSSFQSLLGYYQIKRFKEKQDIIDRNLKYYKNNISKNLLKSRPLGFNSKYSNYFLTFITKKRGEEVEAFMCKNNIDIGIKDEIMDLCKNSLEFKNSRYVYHHIFQVPLHHNLKKKEIEKISNALNSFFC